MELALILVPYHLGVERTGMGLGPERFLQAGVHRQLVSQGHSVHIEIVECRPDTRQDEIDAVAEINALLAGHARSNLEQERFPLILAGNCNACLGALAGIAARPVGVIWLDAHGDFNTPDTSPSGFLDGMALAMSAGLCHHSALAKIGVAPISSSDIVHIGGRDFDAGEKERLMGQRAQVLSASQLRQAGLASAVGPALAALRSRVRDVYLHLDLDVLDPAEATVNEYPAPDGLFLSELEDVIRMVGEEFAITAAALTAYNPACDEDGRALRAGLQVIYAIVDDIARRQ